MKIAVDGILKHIFLVLLVNLYITVILAEVIKK